MKFLTISDIFSHSYSATVMFIELKVIEIFQGLGIY